MSAIDILNIIPKEGVTAIGMLVIVFTILFWMHSSKSVKFRILVGNDVDKRISGETVYVTEKMLRENCTTRQSVLDPTLKQLFDNQERFEKVQEEMAKDVKQISGDLEFLKGRVSMRRS